MQIVSKVLSQLRSLLKILGAAALIGMTLLTCADVVGRYLGYPIFGAVEIVGYMATLTVVMALAYTHELKGHIGVEILVRHFSIKTQAIVELCTNTTALVLFGIITWRMYLYAVSMQKSGEVSMNLELPEHVIIYVAAFCFLVFVLTLVEEIFATLNRLMDRE